MENSRKELERELNKVTWLQVKDLKDLADNIHIEIYAYVDGKKTHTTDDYERKIIDEATAQIRAHREKKFKDALARYIAEQGGNT